MTDPSFFFIILPLSIILGFAVAMMGFGTVEHRDVAAYKRQVKEQQRRSEVAAAKIASMLPWFRYSDTEHRFSCTICGADATAFYMPEGA